MKKLIVVICLAFLLTGCINIKDLSYEQIIQNFSTKASKANIYKIGYKYFLPRGMQVEDSSLYNEVIQDGRYIYYLYVDVVSYYNNVNKNYQINNNAVYSSSVSYEDRFGYVEINLTKNDKYLVEIMYNYAKIEVIVDRGNINEVLLSTISILKSIEYNDSIIANILGDDVLNFYEEEFDIFEVRGNENSYIQADDNYEQLEEKIPDTDLIN